MMPSRKPWIKLYTSLLDDYEIYQMSDAEFVKYIRDLAKNPAYTYCDVSPARYAWSLIRKAKSKEVYTKDIHACKQCGSTENLEIDHIVPLARGGSNELDNLQILCKKCNRRKWAN